jgi:branched-subunit amino acid ABC-type transport system permease component
MGEFLWIGSALGAVPGLLHGIHLYRQQAARPLTGAYYGLWAFALWTLFGSYLLAFWILGALAMGIARLLPRRQAS